MRYVLASLNDLFGRKPILHEGWQAKLTLVRSGNQLIVQKTYATGRAWNKLDAYDFVTAAKNYCNWVKKNGVLLAPSPSKRLSYDEEGWIVTLSQPYLGDDCEVAILQLGNRNNVEDIIRLFRQLVKIAMNLAWKPISPVYRCEVKPRDFCLTQSGIPILVDTVPPVLACSRRNRIICATREQTWSCIVDRELGEVLDITGSALGVIRNLCEHMMALVPQISDLLIKTVIQDVSHHDIHLGRLVRNRLTSRETALKIEVLNSRVEERRYCFASNGDSDLLRVASEPELITHHPILDCSGG